MNVFCTSEYYLLARRNIIYLICIKLCRIDEQFVECVSLIHQIVALMQEAAIEAYEEHMATQEVRLCHVEKALTIVTPRINKESISFYERFHKTFNKK